MQASRSMQVLFVKGHKGLNKLTDCQCQVCQNIVGKVFDDFFEGALAKGCKGSKFCRAVPMMKHYWSKSVFKFKLCQGDFCSRYVKPKYIV